jgi:hypothetical protein
VKPAGILWKFELSSPGSSSFLPRGDNACSMSMASIWEDRRMQRALSQRAGVHISREQVATNRSPGVGNDVDETIGNA